MYNRGNNKPGSRDVRLLGTIQCDKREITAVGLHTDWSVIVIIVFNTGQDKTSVISRVHPGGGNPRSRQSNTLSAYLWKM